MCMCGVYTQRVSTVVLASCYRSPAETIRQQGAQSHHLDLGRAPDAHVPLPRHQPEATEERNKFDHGEMSNINLSLDAHSFSTRRFTFHYEFFGSQGTLGFVT